ncbi:MAG: YCF48-related protein [Bacteroidota bacterium]
MKPTISNHSVLYLFIVCLSFIDRPACSQWEWINPLPPGHDYNNLAFVDDSTGWIIGEKGAILNTRDSGKSFTIQYPGRNVNLYGISFLNPSTGYIIGDSSTLFKTTDGGDSWSELTTPVTSLGVNYNSIFFLNELEGWITTTWSGILSTKDGGQSWSIYNDFWEWDWAGPVVFTSSLTGYRSGRFVHKTSDGGAVWTEISNSGNGLPFSSEYGDIFFINDTIGWVSCFLPNIGHIARTLDGGETWSVVFSGPSAFGFHFIDINTGWCINQYGVQMTTDGGYTWQQFPLNCKSLFITGNTGYASGRGGIIAKQKLHDNLWTRLDKNILDNEKINDIFFNDPELGFIAADSGKILRTANGGKSWELKRISDTELDNLYFTDAATGWLSDRSAIYHTADSGNTWIKSFDRSYLKDIFFLNADTGWAVGWYYGMIFTPDGGITWSDKGFDGCYFDFIYFKDRLTGWTSGPSGMRKTTDGGDYWMEIPGPAEESIYDMKFYNGETGWLAGSYGLIMKTTDGGQSWDLQRHTPSAYNPLKEIRILDSLHVYVIGDVEGVIYATEDGGITWKENACITNQIFNSLFLLDRNKGFLGGLEGALLEYNGNHGIPAYPTNLMSLSQPPGSVVLSWTDNSNNETGFDILRSNGSSGNYHKIGSVGAGVSSFTDAGIDLSTTHWYKVRALNKEGFSATTREVCAGAMVPSIAPDLISPVYNSECHSGNVLLIWSSVPSATGYYLQVAVDSDFNYLEMEQQDIADTLIKINTLYNYSSHYWRVAASNAFGHGKWSNSGYFSLAVDYPAVPQPGSPPNGATDLPLSVVISWYSVQNAETYHLKVFPSDYPETPVFDQAEITDTSVIISGLSGNTSYSWIVCATNIAGTSEWSYDDFRYFVTGLFTNSDKNKKEDYFIFSQYPNPFSRISVFEYCISEPVKVEFTIYSLTGAVIKVLVDEYQSAGQYLLEWDGSDQNNQQVPDGYYYYRIQTTETLKTGKLCRIR